MHLKIIAFIRRLLFLPKVENATSPGYRMPKLKLNAIYFILGVHFNLQLLLPFRFLLYPGKLYWTEEGYRFSWRVMLMEKAGTAFFYVKDLTTGKRSEIITSRYLTNFQETQMSTQPDMILQFAHFLAQQYRQKGIANPVVTVQSYVTLNGSGSKLYIDSTVNLAEQQESFRPKRWIIPFNSNSK